MPPTKKRSKTQAERPPKKDVVEAIVREQPEKVTRKVTKKDGSSEDKEYYTIKCPKLTCHKGNKHEISWEVGSGYSNPYSHLCTCFGGEDALIELYYEAQDEAPARQGTIHEYFQNDQHTDHQKAIQAWISLIVHNSLPCNVVEDRHFREFAKHRSPVSSETITRVLFVMVDLVEDAIAAEMKAAKCGALMHGAYTKMEVQYIGIFACYMREEQLIDNNQPVSKLVPTSTLISVAPIAFALPNGAVSNNAKAMKAHIENILIYYKVEEKMWNKVIIADSAQVNLKLCGLLGKPFIGCRSHALAMDVEDAFERNTTVTDIMEKASDAMDSLRRSIKDPSLLRMYTVLKPKTACKPRWFSNYQMLDHFCKIHDKFESVAKEQGSILNFNDDSNELRKFQETTAWMKEVNVVTGFLHTHCLQLSDCDDICRALRKISDNNRRNSGHLSNGKPNVWKNCSFHVRKALTSKGCLCPHADFINGVCKIQKGEWPYLTVDERTACVPLLTVNVNNTAAVINNSDSKSEDEGPSGSLDMEAEIKRLRERSPRVDHENPYINCDFLYGSAAQVNDLWSIAKYILTSQQGQLTPHLFEALLFLRVNSRLWNTATVTEAITRVQEDSFSERVARKLDEHQQQQANVVSGEDEDDED